MLSASGYAQVRPEDQLRTRKTEGVKINALATYRVASNFATQEQPRSYNNSWGLNSFLSYKKLNASLSGSLQYTSVGQEIEASEREQQFFFQDVTASMNYTLWSDSNNSLAPFAFATAPTSQRSQDLGVQGVFGGGLFTNSRFFKNRLIVSNNLMGYGIANSYYFSPLDGETNQSGGASYDLSLAWVLPKGFLIATTVGARLNQFVDGTTEAGFRNITRVNFNFNKWTAFAYYLNGSYPDQSAFELWYIDQYRQIAGAGITYVF